MLIPQLHCIYSISPLFSYILFIASLTVVIRVFSHKFKFAGYCNKVMEIIMH